MFCTLSFFHEFRIALLPFAYFTLFYSVKAFRQQYTKDIIEKQEQFMACLLPVQRDIERFTLFLTRNRDEAKELTAETIARCFEHFDTIKNINAFKSYAMTIARRLFHDQKKTKHIVHHSIQELDDLFSGGDSPENTLEVKLLYKALGTLPDTQQEAIILAEIMGYSHKEIAAIQNSNQAAVKVRIYRGKRALAAILSDEYNVPHYKETATVTGADHL